MISKVKDWKISNGKQFTPLEYDEHKTIIKAESLNFPVKTIFESGQKIWSFDDTFRGVNATIETFISNFHGDMIHIHISTKMYIDGKLEKIRGMVIELDELKDNLLYIELFEIHMGDILKMKNIA